MKDVLAKIVAGERLDTASAKKLMYSIASLEFNNTQIASILSVFAFRGVEVSEMIGFREALLDLSVKVDLGDSKRIDIVGTGGDGKNSFNISTLSCFVVAGAGYKVSKHGNYGSTSISGSSNVLEKLGYKFKADEKFLQKELEKHNITFLHAPLFHPALKVVAPIRKELGIRTFFNIMGPLVNPSKPSNQLLGVYSKKVGELYANVLRSSDVDFTIVHSVDGYDEISLTSDIDYFDNNTYRRISLEELNLNKVNQNDLLGGKNQDEAAEIFMSVLEGNADEAKKNAVLANSAFAISNLAGIGFSEAFEQAKESLISKKALQTLKGLIGE